MPAIQNNPSSTSNSIFLDSQVARWALASVLSLVLFIVAAYAKSTLTTLEEHQKQITQAQVDLIHTETDLAIINAKIDLLMKSWGVTYNGPQFHSPEAGR